MEVNMIVTGGYQKYGFDAYGGTYLKKEDMAYRMDDPQRTDPAGIALGLGEEIEEVEADFFDLLPTINSVWIKNPECKLHMTEKTIILFQNNNVMLRGIYDSAAERLAREYHLRFLHLDTELARTGDYFNHGSNLITLCFKEDGNAFIHQDCSTQGISAGSVGGGENSFDLPADFYLTMTAEEITDLCWGSCYAEILENGKLASFLEKAKAKNGYFLDFRKDR
jgi:hypothetical protein